MPREGDPTDKELIWLAQATGSPAAMNTLALRYAAWIDHRIAMRAQGARLPREDVEDLKQEAFFAFRRAVLAFDPLREGTSVTSQFRTFLHFKLNRLVDDWVRRRQRERGHLDRSPAAARIFVSAAVGDRERQGPLGSPSDDPFCVVEQDEICDRLADAISGMAPLDRWMVERQADGASLVRIAKECRLSYHRARYHWRKVRAQLAASVEGCAD